MLNNQKSKALGRQASPSCPQAILCHMRDSEKGRTMPKAVGTTPSDCSPYGLYDTAGNIAQWTSSLVEGTKDIYRIKGAGFNSMELLCDLNQEIESPASSCLIHLGFRLLFELDESDFV